jgi:hypothetical protein
MISYNMSIKNGVITNTVAHKCTDGKIVVFKNVGVFVRRNAS